jgi:hypothetical protein
MADIDNSVTAKAFLNADVSSRILGKPPWFTYETDPSGRVFTRCLAHNAPILVITPGLPDFSAEGVDEAATKKLLEDLSKQEGKNEDTTSASSIATSNDMANKALSNMMTNMKDNRYYRFNPTPKEYLYILNSMVTRMNTRLSTGNYIPEPVVISGSDSWYGINIYCTNKTTISESASNEYGDSMLESVQSTLSDKMKEVSFIFKGATGEPSADASGTGTAAAQEGNLDSMMGGLMKGAGATIAGEKLMLPKIWKNSSFDKSYSLNFVFQSIYGDIPSIFEHVFKPYLALLALALPRQTGLSSFKNPFLVRIESPGWFNIECGVIDNISITRAPDPDDWSKDGLCKKIEVTMSVRDIYPSLMLSYSTVALNSNIGMAEYLDSLAGISVDNQKAVNIKRALSDIIGGTLGATDSYVNVKLQQAKELLSNVSFGNINLKG